MFSEKIGEWKKIIAGTAVFGFLLSVISGIAGRVGFGSILLRAFIFAVVFGGISIVLLLLIDNFIPELLSSENDEEESENSDSSVIIEEDVEPEKPVSGRNFDITIEDDTDEPDEAAAVAAAEAEELEEISEDGISPADDAEQVEEVEAVEELDAADEAPKKAGASESRAGAGGLPDIGEYAGSFDTHSDNAAGSDGLSSIDGSGAGQSTEILGDMHETQEIVKAVKTVLKKDQEG